MKNRLKRRKKILCLVVCIFIFTGGWYCYLLFKAKTMDWLAFGEEIMGMALSALLSTFLAIWLTRNDILEDDFVRKKDKFGLIAIESGYKKFFSNEDCFAYLKIQSWEDFFCKYNSEKEINIIGIALNGFFADERISLVSKILMLCINENFKVSILVGNPYSEEIKIQSKGQQKVTESHIAESAMNTYFTFMKAIENLDNDYQKGKLKCSELPSKFLKNFFSFSFSQNLPKAFIVRSGSYMIITPYQMQNEGPSVAPTIVVKDADADGFFAQYIHYIKRLMELSCSFGALRKGNPIADFLNQPYGNDLSKEFYDDLHSCKSLSVLGLGQNKMFTNLETQLIQVVQRGGNIQAVMAKPDGVSTNMCVVRSLIHKDVAGAVGEHKRAINILLSIRDKFCTNDVSRMKIYTWDCFFPYTMYAFNIEDINNCRIYIWVNNLFAYSSERDGFVIDGKFEAEYAKKYISQYNQVIAAAIKDQGEIKQPFKL